MRPLWVEFPQDQNLGAVDDKFMVGSSVLLAPVLDAEKEANLAQIRDSLPKATQWYDLRVAKNADMIPAFAREGSAIFTRLPHRRSAKLMQYDPLILTLYPSIAERTANGSIWLDDGESFAFQKTGKFAHRNVDLRSDGALQWSKADSAPYMEASKSPEFQNIWISQVIIRTDHVRLSWNSLRIQNGGNGAICRKSSILVSTENALTFNCPPGALSAGAASWSAHFE